MIEDPVRWKVFNASVLSGAGIVPVDNDAEDILGVVREMLDRLGGGRNGPTCVAIVPDKWRSTMAGRTFFGNGRPSEGFFQRRREMFF
jgi:hypothetical protein